MIDVEDCYEYGDPKSTSFSHSLPQTCSWCLYRGGHSSNCPSAVNR